MQSLRGTEWRCTLMFPTITRGHRFAALALCPCPTALRAHHRPLWFYNFADLLLVRERSPIPPFSISHLHPTHTPSPNPRTTHTKLILGVLCTLPHTPRSGLTTTSSPLSAFSPCSPPPPSLPTCALSGRPRASAPGAVAAPRHAPSPDLPPTPDTANAIDLYPPLPLTTPGPSPHPSGSSPNPLIGSTVTPLSTHPHTSAHNSLTSSHAFLHPQSLNLTLARHVVAAPSERAQRPTRLAQPPHHRPRQETWDWCRRRNGRGHGLCAHRAVDTGCARNAFPRR